MAEWLRRLTRNQFRSAGVGSNPTDREYFLFCLLCPFVTGIPYLMQSVSCRSIVGSVVECSPATRAARVRFPDDAVFFLFDTLHFLGCVRSGKSRVSPSPPLRSDTFCTRKKNVYGDGGYRSPYLSHAKRALYHLSYVPHVQSRACVACQTF